MVCLAQVIAQVVKNANLAISKGERMLPLTFVKTGDIAKVIKVSGKDVVKKHLSDLGFVDGTIVNVISSHDGDIILNVKDSRLAVTREMADKIMIELVDRKDLVKQVM